MSTTVTTSSDYGSLSDNWAHRALLKRPKPEFVHNIFCTEFRIPQKKSKTLAMRRQINFNSDPVVLPEGADPAPEQLQKFDINVTVQEFGKVTLLGRDVLLIVEDDTARGTADNLRQAMHTMLEKVTADVWQSSIPQISCLNGVNGEIITELTGEDVLRAVEFLDEGNTEKLAPGIEGSSNFGTGPVEAAYWMTTHVLLKRDLRKIDSFIPTVQYGHQVNVLVPEFGSIDETRIVTSTLVKRDTSASPTVYSNTMLGAHAVGTVVIDDVATQMILKPLGFNDYLNRFQSMGFTAYFNAVILDDSHIVNLLSTKGA